MDVFGNGQTCIQCHQRHRTNCANAAAMRNAEIQQAVPAIAQAQVDTQIGQNCAPVNIPEMLPPPNPAQSDPTVISDTDKLLLQNFREKALRIFQNMLMCFFDK